VRDVHAKGGLEYVLDRIRNGETMGQIAETFGLSRGMMYNYIKHMDTEMDGEATRLYKRARVDSATTNVEEAKEISDEPVRDQVDVSRNRERVRVRLWMAERFNKEDFGQKPESQVMLIGELHLKALQQYGKPDAQKLQPGDIEDAEVVSIESEEGEVVWSAEEDVGDLI